MSLINSINSSAILLNVVFVFKKSVEKPWILKASSGTSLSGLIILWKILFVPIKSLVSIHAISTILCPSLGESPVVSVS